MRAMCRIKLKDRCILPGLSRMPRVSRESPCLPVRGTKPVAAEQCNMEPNIAMPKMTYSAKRSARAGKSKCRREIPPSKAYARSSPMTVFAAAVSSLYPAVSHARRNSFGTTVSMKLLESSSCICLYRCLADIELVRNGGRGESSRIAGNDL